MYYLGNFAIHILLGLLCCSTVTVEGRSRLLPAGSNSNEAEAREFLRSYNEDAARLLNNATRMEWAYNTNISDANAAAANEASLRYSAFNSKAFEDASNFLTTNFSSDTIRQLASVGSKALSEEEMETLTKIVSDMGGIYGKGQACLDRSNLSSCYNLEPELTEILASTETAEDVRKTLWEDWHNSVGKDLKPYYIQYVELKNRLAKVNNFSDYGEEWRDRYEDLKYDETVKVLYDQMLPLYKKLHAYVRHKLAKHYQTEIPQYLPQHLLGDMWGRFWTNLYKIAVPYPAEPSLDVTENMRKQNYTVRRMYETSDEFYKSMGLIPLPSTFFNVSMLERPEGRDVICHATAWDFYDGKDFRIKMCTNINMDDFLTVHHEMGHIQYFMQYAGQPTVYRDGANDGFHEAVGELMSMCVSTPKHLYAIGLLDDLYDNKETTVNYLFSRALVTVSTLPFHYLQDLWRWRLFRGEIPLERWNEEFWKMSRDIVGVTSPVARPDDVLDGPTIFHVAQDFDMIRYFTRTILQFQFAETLCRESGHVGDLYNCDFYGSLAAGDKLASMLKLGRSKPWKEALEAMTGTQEMSAVPITTYFKPLEEFLDKYIADENLQVGWDNSPPEVGQLAF